MGLPLIMAMILTLVPADKRAVFRWGAMLSTLASMLLAIYVFARFDAALAESLGGRVAAGPRFGVGGAFERFLRLPFTLDEGQLEAELTENIWLTAEADTDMVFDDAHDPKWTRALAGLGVDAARLSGTGGRA